MRILGSITTHVGQGSGPHHGRSRYTGAIGVLQLPGHPVSSLFLYASQQMFQQHLICSFLLGIPLFPPTPLYLVRSSSLFKIQFRRYQVSEPFPDYSMWLIICPPLCFHNSLYLCQMPPWHVVLWILHMYLFISLDNWVHFSIWEQRLLSFFVSQPSTCHVVSGQ